MQKSIYSQEPSFQTSIKAPLGARLEQLANTYNNMQMLGMSKARLDYLIRDAQSLIESAKDFQAMSR
jgi:hypothetical protein